MCFFSPSHVVVVFDHVKPTWKADDGVRARIRSDGLILLYRTGNRPQVKGRRVSAYSVCCDA